MLSSVLGRSLHEIRRSFGWWALGIVGYVALIVAVWPTVKGTPAIEKLHNSYPEALKAFTSFGGGVDFGTPAGYLGAELFSFMMPLLLLVAGIGAGARSIAGEEEAGTLDLLLANPLSRVRLALEKLGAVAIELIALGIVLLAALEVSARVAGMRIAFDKLAAASVSAVLLALAFGAIAFLLGAAMGHRGRAVGIASALAVAAYLLNSLASLIKGIESLRPISPFYHYAASDPLHSGLQAGHVLVLAGIILVASAAAPLLFDRRDLAV
jgi:beta-exotoxin I transport system permease protein